MNNEQTMNHVTKIDDLPNVPNQDSSPVQAVTNQQYNPNIQNANQQYNPNIQNNNQHQNPAQQQNITMQVQQQQIPQNNVISSNIVNQQSFIPNNQGELPSRDIPMNTIQYQNDPNIQVNYVEKKEIPKNIEKEQNDELEKAKKVFEYKKKNNLVRDTLLDDLQIPIFLSILYFGFQLPIIDKNIYKYLPNLFLKEGKLSLSGVIFKSIAFAFIYYIVNNYVLITEN